MSEHKHTPGPWAEWNPLGSSDKWRFIKGIGSEDEPLGDAFVCQVWNNEKREANFKLIAAAPELLAALEVAVEYFDRNDIDCIAHDDAKAAIKKAKGE